MQMTYRHHRNDTYWEDRWEDSGADKQGFDRLDFYPIKYAEMVIEDVPRSATILEAGCGPGRLFFQYRDQGYDITGVDFSTTAIEHIQETDPDADVRVADVRDLPFQDGQFDIVFAFGLFHNFKDPEDLARAFAETTRVLRPGGRLVASVRCDSLENHLIEKITARRENGDGERLFHKLQFDEGDFRYFLSASGLDVKEIHHARNVSFLFKFERLRAREMKSDVFDESIARSEGFRLNLLGSLLDRTLHGLFPKHFSNALVGVAEKATT